MGFTAFNITVLAFGAALFAVAVVVGVVRSRRLRNDTVRTDVAMVLMGVACGLVGALAVAAGVADVVIADVPCAAC